MLARHISKICVRRFSTSITRLQSSTHMPDDFLNNFGKNTASKQDTDTFISVFNKIMSYKNEQKQEKGTLQLIFEKNLNDRTKNLSVMDTKVTGKDIRDLPLSVSGDIVNSTGVQDNKTLISQIQRKHELKESIAPTFQYMEEINSDYELIKFTEDMIKNFSSRLAKDEYKSESLTEELMEQIKTKSEKTPSTPIINQYTIPLFLSKTIKLLCTQFRCPMEAFSLFQNVKNLDIKTYTFSCTTEVYNEVLERSWQNFKDVYLIDSLVSEMRANGIVGDMDTISILGLVLNDMEKLLKPDLNSSSFWNKEDQSLVKSVKEFRKEMMETI